MPLIAITACEKLPNYEASVRLAGGDVRIVAPGTPPDEALQGVDGILLTGGGDVDPRLYGEAPHPTFDPAEPGRDAFELELARRALAADVPMLAICRGIQVLNVARGGTLVQDIPDERPSDVTHRVTRPADGLVHRIAVVRDSRLHVLLAERLTDDGCGVNSRHHQALAAIGDGLRVTATAPDGIVEAVEDPRRRFCIGVQWHPENFLERGEFKGLFDGFVDAARR